MDRMPDPRQLPYLLDLLEDDSPSVQRVVKKELASYGLALEEEIERLPTPPNELQRRAIGKLLEVHLREGLIQAWPNWLLLPRESEGKSKIERALTLLAEFQSGRSRPHRLPGMLDRLAAEAREFLPQIEPLALAHFLFQAKGLKGTTENYYDPQNSNLVRVLELRRGIPISLSLIYILTAKRLGLEVQACNFPGHFLARIYVNDRRVFVDCFDGGRLIEEQFLIGMHMEAVPNLHSILADEPKAEVVVARVLRNLVVAYQQASEKDNELLMKKLLQITLPEEKSPLG